MATMSEIGRQMLQFQEKLAEEYGYAPIGYNLFLGNVRQKYLDALPEWCKLSGDSVQLCTLRGTLIASGYRRIVIGDYGAFVEFTKDQIKTDVLRVKPGQEYRVTDPQFKDRVKYHWLTAKDTSGVKVYYQQKTVAYADYLPGMYYISPYELCLQSEATSPLPAARSVF